jgi:ketosteroid isomerase-like protein
MDAPMVVERYFAALCQRDAGSILACFAPRAVVEENGRTYEGQVAIKAWTQALLQLDVDFGVSEIVRGGDEVQVSVVVTGSFIGSPATRSYRFLLDDGLIARLRIGF